jgi:hypothetical protein
MTIFALPRASQVRLTRCGTLAISVAKLPKTKRRTYRGVPVDLRKQAAFGVFLGVALSGLAAAYGPC